MTEASPGNACVELLVVARTIQRVLEIWSFHSHPDSIDVDLLLVDPHVEGTLFLQRSDARLNEFVSRYYGKHTKQLADLPVSQRRL